MTSPMSSPRAAAAATSIRPPRPAPPSRRPPRPSHSPGPLRANVRSLPRRRQAWPGSAVRVKVADAGAAARQRRSRACGDAADAAASEGDGGGVRAAHGGADAGQQPAEPAADRTGGPGAGAGGAAGGGPAPAGRWGSCSSGDVLCWAGRRVRAAPARRESVSGAAGTGDSAGRRSRAGRSRAGTRGTCGASTSSRQSHHQCTIRSRRWQAAGVGARPGAADRER